MKVVLVGINAKYIHTNLAIRYLREYGNKHGQNITICEFTINHRKEQIIAAIVKEKPDVLGFSCYIWNIGIINEIIPDIKIIMPNVTMVLGGPEVSFDNYGLSTYDFIVSGEGEKAFLSIITALKKGEQMDRRIKQDTRLSCTVFPYSPGELEQLNNHIIYYETQRGCPFICAYCLSSAGNEVQLLSLSRVYKELDIFLNKGVKQVKLVDRTFNMNKTHSRAVWEYLINNDNGSIGFHFEICAELLDDVDFSILEKARIGLFQFEIGIQSTNERTLSAIDRHMDFKKLSSNVRKLKALGNIHLHLDLIAGLPYEDIVSFRQSFNDAFSLKPDALQLGFLKALKGCKIRNDKNLGISYSANAPYEVLKTSDLTYADLIRLKKTEFILNHYYNSLLTLKTIEYLLPYFDSPYDFFSGFGEFWEENGYDTVNHSKMKMYEILLAFAMYAACRKCICVDIVKETLIYDILINDNIKKLPNSIAKATTESQQRLITGFYGDRERIAKIEPSLLSYTTRQLRKQCNIVFFEFDVAGGFNKKETVVLFYYLDGHGVSYLI